MRRPRWWVGTARARQRTAMSPPAPRARPGQRLQHSCRADCTGAALCDRRNCWWQSSHSKRGRRPLPLRCQRIAHHTRGIDLLVQQACSGKTVEHAVHRDAVDQGRPQRPGRLPPRPPTRRRGGARGTTAPAPGWPGGAHARRQSPGQGLVTRELAVEDMVDWLAPISGGI